MSDRKENLKKNLGITEYPWSSDDEDSDSDTLFRQPNEESDVSNEANEEQGELNSVWEDEPRATRLGHEQLWALSNDPSRAFREDLQGNSPSDENIEHFPSVGLHRVIKYKRPKRRDGSTFRHAMRPVSAPMDLRSNVVKVRGVHTSASRVSLPRLTGASIVSLVRERPDVPSDPQPSTSRGFGNPNASNQPSSDTNIVIPANSLFSHNKRRFISLKPPAFSFPSTSTANRAPFSSTSSTSSALFNASSAMIQPTANSERPNAANQPTPGNEQPVQALAPVTASVGQDETTGETNDIVGRGGQVLDEVVSALQVAIADGDREDSPDLEDAVMDVADVALGLTEQPSPERRAGKRKIGDEREHNDCVRAFNQALLRLLECPVCLECMEPPITQCRRGHLVCARCRSRLSSCPVCRTPFSSVRNRAMEGVAELLLYPCRHSCGDSVRLRSRGAHEASCPARRYRCPAVYCHTTAALPLPDLLEHLQKSHAALMKTGRKHKFSLKMNTKHHDTWLVLIDGDLFSLRIDVDIRSWGIVVYVAYVGPKCNANNFYYEVTVIGHNNERRLTYSRVTHSDLESSSANVSRQDCFHLMLDQALNYLRTMNKHSDPDKVLNFVVEINKGKISETQAENESP